MVMLDILPLFARIGNDAYLHRGSLAATLRRSGGLRGAGTKAAFGIAQSAF